MFSNQLNFKSLTSTAVFISAALFSVASHAETCPQAGELIQVFNWPYVSYYTESGWSSNPSNAIYGVSGLKGAKFDSVTGPAPVKCDYNVMSPPNVNIMPVQLKKDIQGDGVPDLGPDTSWTGFGERGQPPIAYVCNSGDPGKCPFTLVNQPVLNPSSNPFGHKAASTK